MNENFLFSEIALAIEQGQSDLVRSLTLEALKTLQKSEGRLAFRCHPLGFLMLPLANLPDKRTLRVHLWIPGFRTYQEPYWPIHDHIFSYISCVINGELKHVVYKTEQGTVNDQPIYVAQYLQEESLLLRTDNTIRLVCSTEHTHKAGTLYNLAAQVFHETIVDASVFAATVMLTTPSASVFPRILGARDGVGAYRYLRKIIDFQDYEYFLLS